MECMQRIIIFVPLAMKQFSLKNCNIIQSALNKLKQHESTVWSVYNEIQFFKAKERTIL